MTDVAPPNLGSGKITPRAGIEHTFESNFDWGDYTWRVRVIDQDNSVSEWTTANFTLGIDNEYPAAPTINSYNDGAMTEDTTPTFEFDLSDPDDGDNVVFDLEVDAAGGDFSTPMYRASEYVLDQKYVSLASGYQHTAVLMQDGTVWTWGENSLGQLGIGSDVDTHTPVQVTGLTDVTALAVGYYHTVALKKDGTVWTWGYGYYGQLGDGSNEIRTTPVQVNISNIRAISAGTEFTVAVRADGTVWSWGSNNYLQLGDGTSGNKLSPVQVLNLTDVVKVASGDRHTLALKSDGTVWSWGYNNQGQLGDGSYTNRNEAVEVTAITDVVSISAGNLHSSVVKSDGTVWSWGYGYDGQLGRGSNSPSITPVQATGLTNVTEISSKARFNIALKDDGTVWAWGHNYNGNLGDGSNTTRYTPVQVNTLTGATVISAGVFHTMAGRDDGSVWIWGANSSGQLGDGTTNNTNTPGQVSGISNLQQPGTVAAQITPRAGESYTFATDFAFGDYIWRVRGKDQYDYKGPWTVASTGFSIGDIPYPPNDPVLNNYDDGKTYLINEPAFSFDLSDPDEGTQVLYTIEVDEASGDFSAPEYSFTEVAADGSQKYVSITGTDSSIALKRDGTVWAWGRNDNGQLGDGTTTNRSEPVQVSGISEVIALSN